MKISIDSELRGLCPSAALGVLHYRALVQPSDERLLARFEETVDRLAAQYTTATIAQNPHIASTRAAYKTLGKNPHEYKNAAEAMLRRIVKGQGLYRIQNVVDINNLISVSSGYSIGSYDVGQLQGEVVLRRAEEGAHYDGIGKGSVNIGCLPVLYDALGAFGNPTSDSRRAMLQPGRRELCSVLYSFDGPAAVREWMEEFARLLEEYCGVCGIEQWTV